jgi:mono/diheme cytochrome c family protein
MNDPWALEDVRSIPGAGTRKLVAIATGHHTLAAGPVCVITPAVGMNTSAAIRIVTPGVKPPEGGMSGTPVEEGGVTDFAGLYMTPWPLSEEFFLVSYTFSDEQTDAVGYAVYLIDVFGNKELVYRDPSISCFTPIPLRPRPRPPILPDACNPAQPQATCSVASITHGVEGVRPEQARYLRISHRLQWPYDNRYGGHRYHRVAHTRGIVPNWTPARVIGTVPVEPDGSAHFTVPADTPVYFQLLDENQMELRRMRSFISFQPGEVRSCVGCHETREEAVVGGKFPVATLRPPSVPEPPPWGDRPISFLRDIQPVFDKHCTACHSGLKPAAGLDFSGGLTVRNVVPAFSANTAYDTIRLRELVSRSNIHEDARITAPLAFGSHQSKLIHAIREGACSKHVNLSDQEWLRLVTWIDANAPYHDRFINKRTGEEPYDLPADQELGKQLAAVHSRRCSACHEPGGVSRLDWINIRQPERSLFLAAPLAAAPSATRKCSGGVYKDRNDPDYQAVLRLVEQAAAKALKNPRRDIVALLD